MKATFKMVFFLIAYIDVSLGYSLAGRRRLLSCADQSENCPQYLQYCSQAQFASLCPQTCGTCDPEDEVESQQTTSQNNVAETTVQMVPTTIGELADGLSKTSANSPSECKDGFASCQSSINQFGFDDFCVKDIYKQAYLCEKSCEKCDASLCSLSCENGGTLNSEKCDCECDHYWSGESCGECSSSVDCHSPKGVFQSAYCMCVCVPPWIDDCSVCDRSCHNGGTLESLSCVCQCPDGYSGDECQTFTGGTTSKPATLGSETGCMDDAQCDLMIELANQNLNAPCENPVILQMCPKYCGQCTVQTTGAPEVDLPETTIETPTVAANPQQPSTQKENVGDTTTQSVQSQCALQCQNGGTLDENSCTCVCDSDWEGPTCSAEKLPAEEAVENLAKEVASEKSDVAILVDTSGSIGIAMHEEIREFLQALVGNIEEQAIDESNLRFALTSFSENQILNYNFDSSQTKQSILNAISNIQYSGGTTFLSNALLYEEEAVFAMAREPEEGVQKYLLLFSDGMDMSDKNPLESAQILRDAGIKIWVFCPSEQYNESVVKGIAGNSDQIINMGGLEEQDLKKLIAGIKY